MEICSFKSSSSLYASSFVFWLISREQSNSQVNDPLFYTETCRGPWRISAGSNLEAFAAAVLTTDLRNKLWVYDVVSRLKRLHHVEAAVACAVEKSSELTQNPKSNFFKTPKYL